MDFWDVSILNLISIFVLISAKILLVLRILRSRSCAGISGKTQVLYAVVLTSRFMYLLQDYARYYGFRYHLFFYSKLAALLTAYSIVLIIYRYYKGTYEKQDDDFKILRLLLPAALLAALVSDTEKLFWSFSLYLEAVSIIPQIQLYKNTKRIEKHAFVYICLLTIYRSLNAIDELNNRINHHYYDFDDLNMTSALIQIMICSEFLVRIKRDKEETGVSSNDITIGNLKEVVLSPAMFAEKPNNIPILPIVHEEKKINFDSTAPKY